MRFGAVHADARARMVRSMQPLPGAGAHPSRARRWIIAGAIVIGLLGVAACGVLGMLGLQLMRAVDHDVLGDLDSDAPRWSPSDIDADARVILGAPLPATATNVHYRHSPGGPDVIGALRADMTEPELRALMSRTGLTPWGSARAFSDDTMWLGFSTYPGPTPAPWWTPPTTIDESVWVRQDGSVWRMARFDGHTLLYSIISH